MVAVKRHRNTQEKSDNLHHLASSRIFSRLFCEVHSFIHPIFNLTLVIQQARHRTLEQTLQLIRMTEIATVQKKRKGHKLWAWMRDTYTQTRKWKTYLFSIQFQSNRAMEDPWKRREGGHNMSFIKVLVERVSRSRHETQKPHSHCSS